MASSVSAQSARAVLQYQTSSQYGSSCACVCSQWPGASVSATSQACGLVGASPIDMTPNDNVIELLTVETRSVAMEAVSAESFGVARAAKSKPLDVAGSAKSST